MLRVVHVSDPHLGVRFKQLIGRDVHKFVNSHILDNIRLSVDYAIEAGADLYILTGDVFNKIYHSLEYSHSLIDILMRLIDAGIYVVIIAGNHDIPRVTNIHNTLYVVNKLGLDKYVFIEEPLEEPTVYRVGGSKVGIVSLPYVHILDNPRRKIEKHVVSQYEKISDTDYKILATHMDVHGAKYSESDTLIRSFYMLPYRIHPETLHPELFDYVALGHIHLHQPIRGYENMWYAGSIDRVNFGEVGQAKGFLRVDIDGGVSTEFIETKPLKMFIIKELVFRRGFTPSDFISYMEEYSGLEDSLLKIEAVFDRDSWEVFRSKLDRIREYLLVNRGVRGFIVLPHYIHVSPDIQVEGLVSLDRGWIEKRLREYIKSLREIEKEDREHMLGYAVKFLRDVFGE